MANACILLGVLLNAVLEVKAYIDISAYWPVGTDGKPLTVNAVYSRFINTENQVSYETLKLAYEGRLDRGKVSNQVKLANIASILASKPITVNDLIRIEDDEE